MLRVGTLFALEVKPAENHLIFLGEGLLGGPTSTHSQLVLLGVLKQKWSMPTTPVQLLGIRNRGPWPDPEVSKRDAKSDLTQSPCDLCQAVALCHVVSIFFGGPQVSLSKWVQTYDVSRSRGFSPQVSGG